jgi:hypothetical protein
MLLWVTQHALAPFVSRSLPFSVYIWPGIANASASRCICPLKNQHQAVISVQDQMTLLIEGGMV